MTIKNNNYISVTLYDLGYIKDTSCQDYDRYEKTLTDEPDIEVIDEIVKKGNEVFRRIRTIKFEIYNGIRRPKETVYKREYVNPELMDIVVNHPPLRLKP